MGAAHIPKITWGPAFANTLTIGYPLDNAVSYPEPGAGSEWADIPAGPQDAWITGTDQVLEGDVRWIPATDAVQPVAATGWDGAAGWAAFLTWARNGNAFRFYPDRSAGTYLTCHLLEPRRGAPPLEDDGSRRLRLRIRSSTGTAFTGY